jgi:hypothetical protein
MRIAIAQASKLFLICSTIIRIIPIAYYLLLNDSVSDNTQRHATASNLRLHKVSVREIDITHGIPTDLPKTSSYNADQEVQLEFATKESEYTLYF